MQNIITQRFYKYGCPFLKKVDHFQFIPISSINEVVHIVPRFDYFNSFYVNKYIYNWYHRIIE